MIISSKYHLNQLNISFLFSKLAKDPICEESPDKATELQDTFTILVQCQKKTN